jgi:hypothetical protein
MKSIITMCLLALALSPSMLFSQVPVPVDTGQPIPVLSGNELDGLVAPIALYPDPLISQILVAATYPLEVVEAYQWVQRNPGLSGPALTQAAQEQNWDPSVQALVMFPDVLRRLNEDVNWTTSLGNAFLNQQADVMGAVQRMRLSAEQSGRLASTPQQQVINTTNAGQPVVEIVPANPEVIYVPVYDPAWVWGPAAYYPYPNWYYPRARSGVFFNVGISVGGFFGRGWGGWGGYGWHPEWGRRTVVVNNTFIRQNNFNSTHVTNVGRASWNNQYRGNVGARENFAARQNFSAQPNFNNRQNFSARPNFNNRQNFSAQPNFNNRQNFSAPQNFNNRQNFSAQQNFNNRQNFRPAPAPAPAQVRGPVNAFASSRANSFAPSRMNTFAPPQMSRPAFAPSYSRPSMPMARSGGGGSSRGSGNRDRGRERR